MVFEPSNRFMAVHPHMRGEHRARPALSHWTSGSSPHAWGTRIYLSGNFHSIRFIPTCVGNTPTYFGYSCNNSVHPHMRGEHKSLVSVSLPKYGSSPHAWGTHQ